jgi:hypothetical protein
MTTPSLVIPAEAGIQFLYILINEVNLIMKKMTLEEIEKLIEQLTPAEQLKLVALVCERLSGTDISFPINADTEKLDKKQVSKYLLEYP